MVAKAIATSMRGFRESASASTRAAFALRQSTTSPAARPSSANNPSRAGSRPEDEPRACSRWLSSGCLSFRLGFGRRSFHEFGRGAPLPAPTADQALVERQCHVAGDVIRSHSRDRVARHAPTRISGRHCVQFAASDWECHQVEQAIQRTRRSGGGSRFPRRARRLGGSECPASCSPCDAPLAPVRHLRASFWVDNVEACIAQRLDDTRSSCPKAWRDFSFMRWRQLTDS